MGLGSRILQIFKNFAVLVPVIVLLLVSAIMSANSAAKIAKLNQTDTVKKAHKMATAATVFLWIMFAFGMMMPGFGLVASVIPYLFFILAGVFTLLMFTLAPLLFYAASQVKKSDDYANGDSNAKKAFTNSLVAGILMIVAAVFSVLYAIYAVRKYRKGGGLTGDVALAAEITSMVQPELAPITGVIGAEAKHRLSADKQKELAKRTGGVQGLANIGQQLGLGQQLKGGLGQQLKGGLGQTFKSGGKGLGSLLEGALTAI